MKKTFKIAIILALTFILVQIERDFKNRDFFNISKIEITEVSPSLKIDLEKIKTEILGKNINNLDLSGLEKEILKDIRIKKVNVYKQNLNELVIDVVEKESSYYVQYKSRVYTIDKDGVVFGKMEEYLKKSTPILVLENNSEKEKLLEVLQKLSELDLKDEVSQLYFADKNLVYIVLRDGIK
ncbi:MAG: cell division protein FtsQ/DivIB, partial [Cetobacterium sp.]